MGALPACMQLETASYPPDEAAPRERMLYRLQHCPALFLVAQTQSTVEGQEAIVVGLAEQHIPNYWCSLFSLLAVPLALGKHRFERRRPLGLLLRFCGGGWSCRYRSTGAGAEAWRTGHWWCATLGTAWW